MLLYQVVSGLIYLVAVLVAALGTQLLSALAPLASFALVRRQPSWATLPLYTAVGCR